MFKFLKHTALGLLLFCIPYAICVYFADFTAKQSILVGAFGFFAIQAFRIALALAKQQQPQFEPFWVRIRPNWFAICHDFGLAAGEEWVALQERMRQEVDSEAYSVIRNGLNFTMLSPTLFYSNDHQTFFSELDFKISIEELSADPDSFSSFAPQFYIKRTLAGKEKYPAIEIGLVTRESLKKNHHPLDNDGNIPIAWVPEIVFYSYFHADKYDGAKLKAVENLSKTRLAECGWTEEERDPEDDWINWPIEINHKYVHVTYRGI